LSVVFAQVDQRKSKTANTQICDVYIPFESINRCKVLGVTFTVQCLGAHCSQCPVAVKLWPSIRSSSCDAGWLL